MNHVAYTQRFTRIELIVVALLTFLLIAIIFVMIWTERDRAQFAAALASLKNAYSVALLCVNDASDLTDPLTATSGITAICPDTKSVWPQLPGGWSYVEPVRLSVDSGGFLFGAMDKKQTKKIVCTIDGCQVFEISPADVSSTSSPR